VAHKCVDSKPTFWKGQIPETVYFTTADSTQLLLSLLFPLLHEVTVRGRADVVQIIIIDMRSRTAALIRDRTADSTWLW
jgi:hypothetical protein